jgi:hypothetical protein
MNGIDCLCFIFPFLIVAHFTYSTATLCYHLFTPIHPNPQSLWIIELLKNIAGQTSVKKMGACICTKLKQHMKHQAYNTYNILSYSVYIWKFKYEYLYPNI